MGGEKAGRDAVRTGTEPNFCDTGGKKGGEDQIVLRRPEEGDAKKSSHSEGQEPNGFSGKGGTKKGGTLFLKAARPVLRERKRGGESQQKLKHAT